jgi:hypothetical protein
LNLEGYTNLGHWVAELDKRIEGILLQRLVHIIEIWCAEFDHTDNGDTQRDAPIPETFSKWRGDKRLNEERADLIPDACIDRLLIAMDSSWKAT